MNILGYNINTMDPITWIIGFIITWTIWQILTRAFKLWYWKINRSIENQEIIIDILNEISAKLDKK